MNRRLQKQAFTLVELLVVITIIALLIGIALPAFKGAKRAAKNTATQAAIAALEAGLQQYREERALGNTYPPSASDERNGAGYAIMEDPVETSGANVHATGATLLVYGLAGADLQGTRGFKKAPGLNTWAKSMSAKESNGLYSLSADPPWPKYGPYVGSDVMDRAKYLKDLKQFPVDQLSGLWPQDNVQLVFTDNFDAPILYYKARPAARRMLTNINTGDIGIYDYRDNEFLTEYPGSQLTEPREYGDQDFGNDGAFDGFIIDRKASRRDGPDPTDKIIVDRPVNADEYLLISAGSDLLFGTEDDVTNWKN